MSESNVFDGPEALAEMVSYQDSAIVSRTVHKSKSGTMTFFAFDQGEALSEHTAPFDAFVQVLDGAAVISIDGKETVVPAGSLICMPAGIPHALRADKRFQMLLTMMRAE